MIQVVFLYVLLLSALNTLQAAIPRVKTMGSANAGRGHHSPQPHSPSVRQAPTRALPARDMVIVFEVMDIIAYQLYIFSMY